MGSKLDQFCEFIDCHPQIFNYAPQCFSLDGNATVHGNNNAGVVCETHVDGMATCLSPELKSQTRGDAGHVIPSDDW